MFAVETLSLFSLPLGIEAMLDELERNSSDIVDVSQPLPYEYKYEVNNRIEDRLSDDEGLFLPYGMKVGY